MATVARPAGPEPDRTDFAAWAKRQAALLRARRFGELDTEALAEEVESLARAEFLDLVDRMEAVLEAVLRYQSQAAFRCEAQRNRIAALIDVAQKELDRSPSFAKRADEAVEEAWGGAVLKAMHVTGQLYPDTCPYSWAQLRSIQLDP
jgi:thioesterase domain-containing protein